LFTVIVFSFFECFTQGNEYKEKIYDFLNFEVNTFYHVAHREISCAPTSSRKAHSHTGNFPATWS